MSQSTPPFWSVPAEEFLRRLQTSPQGLTTAEAQRRLARHGPNALAPKARSGVLTLLLTQFRSPITLLLLVAAALSIFLGDTVNAVIILAITLASVLLSFWQEYSASRAMEKLL